MTFLLVLPSARVALDSRFSTLGVVENGLIEAPLSSLSSFYRRYDLVEAGFRCRILRFLYQSFVYHPIHVADVVKGFTVSPPVPSPVGLWRLSVVHPWQGDGLLQLESSRLGWSR